MKGGTYTKTLAKIQVRGSYTRYPKKCHLLENAGAHLMVADGNQQKHLLYKSVNLFLEKLINIKVILFLIHELFYFLK